MKTNLSQTLLLALLMVFSLAAHAQVSINGPVPGIARRNDIDVHSNGVFAVMPRITPTTAPSSGTFTMSCATSPANLTGAVGTLLDPGGGSTYPANLSCTQTIGVVPNDYSGGYELTFNFIDTEANGDSVIIEDANGGRNAFSGTITPPVLVVPATFFKVTFKSNGNATVGAGFSLRWRRVFSIAYTTYNYLLSFDTRTGNLTAGTPVAPSYYDLFTQTGIMNFGNRNEVKAYNATAMGGLNTIIRSTSLTNTFGTYGVAIGYNNRVTGNNAVAFGTTNQALANNSAAFGTLNQATGIGATALGWNSRATGDFSSALGADAYATGAISLALGRFVNTNNFNGACVIGDNSGSFVNASADNQFTTRFVGGYRMLTNAAATVGVQLAPGGNAWSAISDSARKERFLPLDHAALLTNIRTLRLGTWNYKGQRDQRHYGPMAQDFFARFGHDALGTVGCDTLINSHDFTAVTLSGVQALALENEQLKARIAQLERERTQTTARLDALERRLFVQPAPRVSGTLRRKRMR